MPPIDLIISLIAGLNNRILINLPYVLATITYCGCIAVKFELVFQNNWFA